MNEVKKSGGTGRRLSEAESKKRLLEVAMAEFAEKGYRGATLRSMAAKVDVTAALFTYHFDTKQKLAAEVIKDIKSAIKMPKPYKREDITSDMAWRVALKSYITSLVDIFTSKEAPLCHFAALYRHEAADVSAKESSLHDTCLEPIFTEIESLVAMGVPGNDPCATRLWSLALWNLVLAYALKDERRIHRYVPNEMSPALFKAMTIDFMVDKILGSLHFQGND